MRPSSYLGDWESGTAIPVSNKPFGPKLWKAEERASKPFLYQPTAPPNWYQIFRKIIWASARSSSLSNWRVCWLWIFHRVSKVAAKGGHNLRLPHGERESTRKLGSKKLVHKNFSLRKWRRVPSFEGLVRRRTRVPGARDCCSRFPMSKAFQWSNLQLS